MRNGKKKRKVKFSDESRRVGRSLIIANKSIKETENLIFFQCKIKFYFIHEHQNLYFHSWLLPLESRRVDGSLIIANKSIKETENLIFFQCKIKLYFIHEHQNLYFHSWLPPLVKILLLVSIRWNKIRSHTEKKNNNNKYPLSAITVFQYFKYINNKLKDRNIVVKGKVTISTVEQNDTCTSI